MNIHCLTQKYSTFEAAFQVNLVEIRFLPCVRVLSCVNLDARQTFILYRLVFILMGAAWQKALTGCESHCIRILGRQQEIPFPQSNPPNHSRNNVSIVQGSSTRCIMLLYSHPHRHLKILLQWSLLLTWNIQ